MLPQPSQAATVSQLAVRLHGVDERRQAVGVVVVVGHELGIRPQRAGYVLQRVRVECLGHVQLLLLLLLVIDGG